MNYARRMLRTKILLTVPWTAAYSVGSVPLSVSIDVTRLVEDDQGRGLIVVLKYDSSCERDGSIWM